MVDRNSKSIFNKNYNDNLKTSYLLNKSVPIHNTSLVQTIDKKSSLKISPTFANIIGGVTQALLVTVVGYPFDLVKARIQAKRYDSSWKCLQGTVKNEGFVGLYRGSSMPLLSHLIKRPIQYPITEYIKSRLDLNGSTSNYYNYLIGGSTSIIGSIIGTPLQVIKISVQTATDNEVKNSYYYIKKNYRNNGIRGFYRGFFPNLLKDVVFGASFIGNYYTFRDYLGSDKWWKNFISGSTAHCITWYLFIPIDYVKTTVQRSETKITVREVIKTSYRDHGFRIFWKGVIPACLRTVPVSGIGMVGYEYVRKSLS